MSIKYTNEKPTVMIELTNKYESAKQSATDFMKNGQIAEYLNALLEMNKYKRLMVAIAAN